MEKILITGANGFIGAHLARLLACSTDVEELYLLYNSRNDRLMPLRKYPRVHIIPCDLRRKNDVESLGDLPITSIIHCATQRSSQQSQLIDNALYNANLNSLIHLANLAHRRKVGRFIHFSAYGVFNAYANYDEELTEEDTLAPGDCYEFSKAQEETFLQYAVRRYPLAGVSILRLPGVFGPGKHSGAVYRFIQNALAKQPISINSPTSLYRMLYIDDVGQIITKLIQRKKHNGLEIFHVAGKDCFSLNQLAMRIKRLTGSQSAIDVAGTQETEKVILDISKSVQQLNFLPMDLNTSLSKFIGHITAAELHAQPTED